MAKVTPNKKTKYTKSVFVKEIILPQSTLEAWLLSPTSGTHVRKTKAKAIFKGKTILVIVSTCKRALSAKGPIINAVADEKNKPVTSGFIEKATPKDAPAKAPWDIEYPIADSRIRTTKTPIKPVRNPASKHAIIALCIIANSNQINFYVPLKTWCEDDFPQKQVLFLEVHQKWFDH